MRTWSARVFRALLPVLLLCAALCAACFAGEDAPGLFPPLEPYDSGFLKVSDLHSIYWEVSGNEEGLPVICLHGGPGAICGPWMRRYFDPERFQIVLFDQRGAGRSRPLAEWRENTTQLLVQDINALREHLKIEKKALLFGGSWGTTLALAYAEQHPDKVCGLVLRGVFLATKQETDHFYHGGAGLFFPEAYADLQRILPAPESLDYPRQLFEMTQSEDREVREKAEMGWVGFESRVAHLLPAEKEETQQSLRQNRPLVKAIAVLENHYMMNACFLEEGQLLRDSERIARIPTFIVNGRYDAICPPAAAWKLSQRLENVKIELAPASGHSSSEPAIAEALVRGVAWVADEVEQGR
ncbi:MAG: prolyl aminopeptidase [Planctomycetes bacterium]|nr:prolyl aminopeptidase [Planctomycetota bacterium]